jgi:superfamily II DNA helicase RecQ
LKNHNIGPQVRPKPDTHEACIEALTELLSSDFAEQSGIIYTLTIKDAESLAADLQKEPIL